MPLRDHFRPPLDSQRHWVGLHATWPVMIVSTLRRKLPRGFFAEPGVHPGSSAEMDSATFDCEGEERWSPPRATLSVATDLPKQDVYEVLVYDERRRARLVAAIEIVSPANKDRLEHRRAFAAKCAGLLRERVSVVIVDIVTTRTPNLYEELLEQIGLADPGLGSDPPLLYAVACRLTKHADEWRLETWRHSLSPGQALPTLPLWLAADLALPLELEESYEQSCTLLNIP